MQHIEHLSRLLHDHVPASSTPALNPAVIDGFYQFMATDRIHVDRLDWQGHPVFSMLWRMPDLKPARQSALVDHVRRQWEIYRADSASPAAEADASPQLPDSPLDAESAPDEPLAASTAPVVVASPHPQDHVYMTHSSPRRDWFDRFTDWVAAVVSLFA